MMVQPTKEEKQKQFVAWIQWIVLILIVVLLVLLTRQVIVLQNYIVDSMEHFHELLHEQEAEAVNYEDFAGSVSLNQDTPIKGDLETAAIALVQYSDFECPYCANAPGQIDALLADHPDIVLIHKDYPMVFHENAEAAAVAGRCASGQGLFWEMYEQLFDHQQSLDAATIETVAEDLGMDMTAFEACVASPETAALIDADVDEGIENLIDGTPLYLVGSFTVEGRSLTLEGYRTSLDDLAAIIDQLEQEHEEHE
ncbi:MAG: DsbA family protein [Anaerolineaceae bacterium]